MKQSHDAAFIGNTFLTAIIVILLVWGLASCVNAMA